MKIRNGFVSNSSSSSYVIAYTEPEKCPHCGRADINIIDLIGKGGYDTSVGPLGYDDVVEELKSWFDDDKTNNIITEMNELNNSEYNFAIVYISYHDETLTELIENIPTIKILHSSN